MWLRVGPEIVRDSYAIGFLAGMGRSLRRKIVEPRSVVRDGKPLLRRFFKAAAFKARAWQGPKIESIWWMRKGSRMGKWERGRR